MGRGGGPRRGRERRSRQSAQGGRGLVAAALDRGQPLATDQAQPRTQRGEPQLGRVGPQQQPELGPSGQEPVRLEELLAGQVREHHARVSERAQAERRRRLDFLRLPAAAEAAGAAGLRREAREQIERYRPRTIGEAARLAGVTPADVAALLIDVERRARARQPA